MKNIHVVRKENIKNILECIKKLGVKEVPLHGITKFDDKNCIIGEKYDFIQEKKIICWKDSENDEEVNRIFEVNEAKKEEIVDYSPENYFAGHIGTMFGGKPDKLTIHLNSSNNIYLIIELYKKWFIERVEIREMILYLNYLKEFYKIREKERSSHANYKTKQEKKLKRMLKR